MKLLITDIFIRVYSHLSIIHVDCSIRVIDLHLYTQSECSIRVYINQTFAYYAATCYAGIIGAA